MTNCAPLYRRQWLVSSWSDGRPRPPKSSAARPLLSRCRRLQRRSLFPPSPLNLDIYVDQRNGRWRHAGNARGLPDRLGDDFAQLLLHFARQPADRLVVEPIRNAALLGLLQPIDGALLLVEVSGIFNLRFDGLELVADFRRKTNLRNINRGGRRVCGRISFEKPGH